MLNQECPFVLGEGGWGVGGFRVQDKLLPLFFSAVEAAASQSPNSKSPVWISIQSSPYEYKKTTTTEDCHFLVL